MSECIPLRDLIDEEKKRMKDLVSLENLRPSYYYMCPHTNICVLKLLYTCPHTITRYLRQGSRRDRHIKTSKESSDDSMQHNRTMASNVFPRNTTIRNTSSNVSGSHINPFLRISLHTRTMASSASFRRNTAIIT